MTYVGFDVHARSTHAAAIDVMTGELSRMRFGRDVQAPVEWLGTLSGPVRAFYEAGPTRYGLYRAAIAAGIGMDVVAPGLTPRGRADRVKTDRKDAELLARCLMAGRGTASWCPLQRWRPTRVGSWLELTPSRPQSGETDRHGAITKTGSTLARRMLVESAWQYAREPRIGATPVNRQAGQPDHILQISDRAQQRLHHLYTRIRARGKQHNVTIVAVARELSCFLWAAATAP